MPKQKAVREGLLFLCYNFAMYIAQLIQPVPGVHVSGASGDVATIKGFEWIFQNAVFSIISLAGIVLFVMLLFGGFKLLTSGGNPESVTSAQKTITYAIVGIAIIALSYLILSFIQTFTGANITTFRVDA